MYKISKNDIERLKIILMVYSVAGVITHGIALFNKISFHDDTIETSLGATYSSGRWAIYILDKIRGLLFKTRFVSAPPFNGIVTLFLFACVTLLLIKTFHILDKKNIIIVSALSVTFPYFSTLFGYMYTSWAYGLCFLIATIACYFICVRSSLFSYIIWIGALAFSVGIYQAVIPFIVTFFLMFEIVKLDYKEKNTWEDFFKDISYYIYTCIFFMGIYFSIEKFFLWRFNVSLTNYQGISDINNTSLTSYVSRLIIAYKRFFQPIRFTGGDVYPGNLYYYYLFIIGFILIGIIVSLRKSYYKGRETFIQVLICILLMPITINFIFVMCDENITIIHVLMQYAQIFTFLWCIYLMERGYLSICKYKKIDIFRNMVFILMILMIVGQSRFDNSVYVKAQYLQNQAISYFTTLITRIQSIEGYCEDYPIIFLNGMDKSKELLFEIPGGVELYYYPGDEETIVNDYRWIEFMKMWCGFSPIIIRDETYWYKIANELEMTQYPNDGSIAIVENCIIVNF